MLNFYECAHLGINGEHILDEALVFTKTQLKRIVNNLEGNLAEQVKHALMRPFHRGMPMVEARLYFSNYKEECSRYDSLRKLGCAHFNYLRLLQKKELYIVSKSEFNALEQLPEYIKPFYKILLNVYAELEMQDGRSHFINAAKQAFERERGQSTTGVGAYMKTFRVSDEDVAIEEIMKMIESAWKDIKEGCLKPREVSMDVIAPILNLARMIDVVYKHDDGFTFPEKALKVYITLLFVDSAPVY
ncbi:Terpene synthase, N-terminal domain-containing protein [Cynara cardunculus var. scolymus]|uniref:Terpene synthase, N-terminal domain-containing protein n=1 Tax=Cynara cardunculus var. scolymus TaxID=59895 RepID=A0A103Y1T8_CYNCS|nr:Terpene synthase, N-terminal domain-containing protein [Cynara cardunculus var. scolymus]